MSPLTAISRKLQTDDRIPRIFRYVLSPLSRCRKTCHLGSEQSRAEIERPRGLFVSTLLFLYTSPAGSMTGELVRNVDFNLSVSISVRSALCHRPKIYVGAGYKPTESTRCLAWSANVGISTLQALKSSRPTSRCPTICYLSRKIAGQGVGVLMSPRSSARSMALR